MIMSKHDKNKEKTVISLKKDYFTFYEPHILSENMFAVNLLRTKPGEDVTSIPDNYYDYAFVFPIRMKKKKNENEAKAKELNEEIDNDVHPYEYFQDLSFSDRRKMRRDVEKKLRKIEKAHNKKDSKAPDTKIEVDEGDLDLIANFIEKGQSNSTRFSLSRLLSLGFEVKIRLSVQKDEIFILFRAPDELIHKFAESSEYRIAGDPEMLRAQLQAGNIDHQIKPIFINEDTLASRYSPYEHIFMRFEKDVSHLYLQHDLSGEYDHFKDGELKPILAEITHEYEEEEEEHKQSFMPDLSNLPLITEQKTKQKKTKPFVIVDGKEHEKFVPGYYPPVFTNLDRLKITDSILKAHTSKGGCQIDFNYFFENNSMLGYYPLHVDAKRDAIIEEAFTWSSTPWNLPIEKLRIYLGEKVTMFSIFLGHISKFLIFPAVIGLIFQLAIFSTDNYDNRILPFYSIMIPIWAMYTLEKWKRLEFRQSLTWGTTKFEELEENRTNFKGISVRSFTDGKDILYYPEEKTAKIQNVSYLSVAFFIAFIIGVVGSIYYFRSTLDDSYSSIVASALNTAQIMIFNILYTKFAIQRTELENHKTETEYEDSLILKTFIFQFINSYTSFFYLAFIAAEIPDSDGTGRGSCGNNTCMIPLAINLAIIFGTRLIVTNSLDILMPYYQYISMVFQETEGVNLELNFARGWFVRNKETAKGETTGYYGDKWIKYEELYPADRNYFLLEFNTTVNNMQRYIDTAIQFGFTILFVTALPGAPFLALVNNYFKVKFDLWKILCFHRRPIPSGAQDIGTWQTVFNALSIICIFTNGAMVFFTMNLYRTSDWKFSLTHRVWLFLGFQWVLLGLQLFAQVMIEDEPGEVVLQKERMDFIESKVVDLTRDNDFNFEYESKKREALQGDDLLWSGDQTDIPRTILNCDTKYRKDEIFYYKSKTYDNNNFKEYSDAYEVAVKVNPNAKESYRTVTTFGCIKSKEYNFEKTKLEKENRKISYLVEEAISKNPEERANYIKWFRKNPNSVPADEDKTSAVRDVEQSETADN